MKGSHPNSFTIAVNHLSTIGPRSLHGIIPKR